MFKLFCGLFTLAAQIVSFVVSFMLFSITVAALVLSVRAAYKMAQRPMPELIAECFALTKPCTLKAIVKWLFRVSFVLAPAICMRVAGICIRGAIELFVNAADKSALDASEPSRATK